jgi:hypothetical protein
VTNFYSSDSVLKSTKKYNLFPGIEKMTEKESAHPSVHQLCELTAAATVNGVNSNNSLLLQQSSGQTLTHNSSESHVRKGDGEELPRSKSVVSMGIHS